MFKSLWIATALMLSLLAMAAAAQEAPVVGPRYVVQKLLGQVAPGLVQVQVFDEQDRRKFEVIVTPDDLVLFQKHFVLRPGTVSWEI